MLDQTSSLDNPLHLILRAPVELHTRYSMDYSDIKDLVSSINKLASAENRPAQLPEREQLAQSAEQLQRKYSKQHLSELSLLLGHTEELLRGDYPLRPVQILPSLHIGR